MLDDTLRLTLASVAVLCLPGLALKGWIGRRGYNEQTLILGLGISLALWPIVFLFLSALHVSVDRRELLGAVTLCGVVVAVQATIRLRSMRVKWTGGIRRHWPWIGLLLIFTATLLWRFIQVRDLVLPAWVDSLHHTEIVNVLRAEGHLPAFLPDYGPTQFYYHFGFHVIAAAFAEVANLPSAQAILILGQILNAVCILAVHRLAMTLTRRPSIGLVAAALTGFVSQMPAYFASWGRYTLLTGLTLLALAMASVVEAWRYPQQRQTRWLLMLLVAGLILTHYVAAIYFGCFVLALLLAGGIPKRLQWNSWRAVLTGVVGGIVLASPWLIHIAASIWPLVGVRTGVGLSDAEALLGRLSYTFVLISPLRMWLVYALAALAIIRSWSKQWTIRLLIVWLLILIAVSNEWLWRIAPLRGDLLLLALFLPFNILAASGFLRLRRLVGPTSRRWRIVWPGVLLTGLLCYSIVDTASIINPITILAKPEDVEALSWVRMHTPSTAHFAINVARWGNLYRGVDGGWWLPILSQRTTILPPGIFYGFAADQQYLQKVQTAAEQMSIVDGCTPYFWWVIQQQQITYVYVSGQDGSLRAEWLDDCAGVERIYANRQVTIYRVNKLLF